LHEEDRKELGENCMAETSSKEKLDL